MKILILEDTDERIKTFKQKLIGKEVTVCKTAQECINVLTNNPTFDYIMLDHDLTSTFERPGKGTGYEVADWIANNINKAPTHILIHSLNNVGAAAMMRRLGDVNLRATYIPFLWDKLDTSRLHDEHKEE